MGPKDFFEMACSDIKYVYSSDHFIGGGDPQSTLDLFKSVLSYLREKRAQTVLD
jgi:hypothetical protein